MSKKEKSKKKVSKNKKKFSLLKVLKIYITVFVSFLIPSTIYLVGFSYESGYYDVFGVQSDIFPNSIEHYFLQGFFKISTFIFTIPNYIEITSKVLPFIGLLYFTFNLEKIDRLRKYIKKKNKALNENENIEEFTTFKLIIESIGFVFLTTFYFFIFILALLFYLSMFYTISLKHGESIALETKKDFKTHNGCNVNKNNPYDCIYIFNQENEIELMGTVISIQNDNVILWDGESAKLLNIGNRVVNFKKASKKENQNKPIINEE